MFFSNIFTRYGHPAYNMMSTSLIHTWRLLPQAVCSQVGKQAGKHLFVQQNVQRSNQIAAKFRCSREPVSCSATLVNKIRNPSWIEAISSGSQLTTERAIKGATQDWANMGQRTRTWFPFTPNLRRLYQWLPPWFNRNTEFRPSDAQATGTAVQQLLSCPKDLELKG